MYMLYCDRLRSNNAKMNPPNYSSTQQDIEITLTTQQVGVYPGSLYWLCIYFYFYADAGHVDNLRF